MKCSLCFSVIIKQVHHLDVHLRRQWCLMNNKSHKLVENESVVKSPKSDFTFCVFDENNRVVTVTRQENVKFVCGHYAAKIFENDDFWSQNHH